MGRGLLHHHAVLHEYRLGGDVAGKAHLVGDHQHGHALFGQLPHDREHLAGQLRVKGTGGLVKVNDLRVGGKGAGNGNALLLSAGKLAGIVVGPVGQTDLFQHPSADLVCLLLWHPAGNDQALGHILQGGLVPEQVVVLEHKGCFFAQPGNVGPGDPAKIEGFAVEHQSAAVSGLQKVQAAQQGGLAGAGRAQNGNNVSFFHTQVHAVQDVQCAAHPAGIAARERPDVEAGLVIVGVKCFVDVFDL